MLALLNQVQRAQLLLVSLVSVLALHSHTDRLQLPGNSLSPRLPRLAEVEVRAEARVLLIEVPVGAVEAERSPVPRSSPPSLIILEPLLPHIQVGARFMHFGLEWPVLEPTQWTLDLIVEGAT